MFPATGSTMIAAETFAVARDSLGSRVDVVVRNDDRVAR